MDTYKPLYDYLKKKSKDEYCFTFDELAHLLGLPELVDSAFNLRQWWENEVPSEKSHSQSKAWMEAGYKAYPDMNNRTVVFKKQ